MRKTHFPHELDKGNTINERLLASRRVLKSYFEGCKLLAVIALATSPCSQNDFVVRMVILKPYKSVLAITTSTYQKLIRAIKLRLFRKQPRGSFPL